MAQEKKIFTTRDINKALKTQILKGKAVRIGGLRGQDSIAVGITERSKVTVEGIAGDFFGALNSNARIILKGNAGRFLGDTMSGGEILVEGETGEGTGSYMNGGIIIVKGDVGDNAGQMCKGGAIIIDGSAGDSIGYYMSDGSIIVTRNVGKRSGDWIIGGRIFVGGEIESLGHNAGIVDLSSSERDELEELFSNYNIKGDVKTFKKIVPETKYPFE